jgi:hypothetical protein
MKWFAVLIGDRNPVDALCSETEIGWLKKGAGLAPDCS